MLDLNQKHGVRLFNNSFGTETMDADYKAKLLHYASQLTDQNALVVFSTGNAGKTQPNAETLLPVNRPDIEKGFLAVTGVDDSKQALYQDKNGTGANACGDAARWCLAADYKYGPVYSDKNQSLVYLVGTSASAPQVTATAALVWSKYPWMTADQVRQTILSTADYIDDGSGANQLYNKTFGWGYYNPETAQYGPKRFSTLFGDHFNANVSSELAIFSNNIGGDAGLIKTGSGILVMGGDSTYTGATEIQNGKLQVTGSIKSDVNITQNGQLSGTGTVANVHNNGVFSTEDGRLTIDGNYSQHDKGTLKYGLEHFLTVKGNASLAGKLEISAQNQGMVTAGKHQVLNAKQITGTFDSYRSTSPFLTVKGLQQTDQQVTVDVGLADAKTAGTVNGGIPAASGDLLNQLMAKANTQALQGESTNLTQYVSNIQKADNKTSAQAILNANAGALFAETPSVLLRNQTLSNAYIAQRAYQVTQHDQAGIWASTGYLDNRSQASGWDTVESEIQTVTAGTDFKITEQTIAGAYLTHYNEDSTFSVQAAVKQSLLSLGLMENGKVQKIGIWQGMHNTVSVKLSLSDNSLMV